MYDVALRQCYGRYLLHFGGMNSEDIDNTELFKNTYFSEGFESERAGFTVGCFEEKIWTFFMLLFLKVNVYIRYYFHEF